MESKDYKAALFEMIIRGKGLQDVVDSCSMLLKNPFVFSNQSLQLVSKSASCSQFPKAFSWFEESQEEMLRVAREANQAGYFRDIYAGDAPVYGTISGIPVQWVAARVRLKNRILGSILVADCQTPFTGEYAELLPLICQTIAFALQQSGQHSSGSQRYAPLLVELLEGNVVPEGDDEALRTHFRLLGKALPEAVRILVMRPSRSEQTMNAVILDTLLSSQFPTSVGIVYKNDCVWLLDAKMSVETIEDRLRPTQTSAVSCGLSRPCCSLRDLRDAYLQADAAIRLSAPKHTHILTQFDAALGPYLLEQAVTSRAMSARSLIVPELWHLLECREGMERARDLAAYLSCGRNVTRAGELRSVHKNSMYYRLDRIVDLTGLDLSDDDTCVQLTLSLSLLGLLPL